MILIPNWNTINLTIIAARLIMQCSQIYAFLAVADRQSFSLAAEKLFITQPAVSKRSGQLEESLGLRLFDRIGKKSLLTPDGIAFS